MIPRYSDIVDLLKKGSTIEAQEKILELREAAMELQEENLELKARISQLEKRLAVKEKVLWRKPSYWLHSEDHEDGPFCQKCYDSNQDLIRLQGGENDCWECKECRSSFVGPGYVMPRLEPRGGFY